jgi:hypothetical protein
VRKKDAKYTPLKCYETKQRKEEFICSKWLNESRDSSVGIATGYGLDGREVRVRFPVRVRDFSLLHDVHIGSAAQPASYTTGSLGYFPGSKTTVA